MWDYDRLFAEGNEVYKQFKIRNWSEETKQTILTALNYYNKYEGLEQIKNN